VAVFALFSALAIQHASSAPAAAPDGLSAAMAPGDIGSALEYLQRLDKFYSQVARPR
jgi:hypothetical protein